MAEIAGQYIKKGNQVYVEGRIKYGKFTNKDGVEQNTCDIIATEMQLLGGKSDGQAAQMNPKASPARPAQAAPAKASTQGGGFDDMSDDIPFRDPMSYRGHHLVL